MKKLLLLFIFLNFVIYQLNFEPLYADNNKSELPKDIEITEVRKINKITEIPLIVTHFSTHFTGFGRSCIDNLDSIIRIFKNNGKPIIYLMHRKDKHQDYMQSDRNPTYAIYSSAGEHILPIVSQEIYVTGGFFLNCLKKTVANYIRNQRKMGVKTIKINFITDSTFHLGGQQFKKFFIDGDELMKELSQSGFYESWLPYFEKISELENWRFEVYIDNKLIEVIRSGKEVIKFNFISNHKEIRLN